MNTMTITKTDQDTKSNIIPFAAEVTRYFMDFLETDFRKDKKSPKRRIQKRNAGRLQSVNLHRYKRYNGLVWSAIKSGLDDGALGELRHAIYTTTLPKPLLELIQEQIRAIDLVTIQSIIELFCKRIDLAISQSPNDAMAASSAAIEGIRLIIREEFLSRFIEKFKESLDKNSTEKMGSSSQVLADLTDLFTHPFEGVVSTIISKCTAGIELEVAQLLSQAFEKSDLQKKLNDFFRKLITGDLFYEISELVNNKSLQDKQELYFYCCDIKYAEQTYPLFYIPVQIEKDVGSLKFTFDSKFYFNKKAVQFVAHSQNENTERKRPLSAFGDRIIYFAEKRQSLIKHIDSLLKKTVEYFELSPRIDVCNNNERQVAKGEGIQITNNCYFGLFDKSDESLINDYEEMRNKFSDGNDALASAFESLVDDFITSNPQSVISEVERDWDNTKTSNKLVYSSPVPLNEEQRQILSALNKADCKYASIEGPPGTGKSHTITAIVCDAILRNQSVLVLSDKEEALDVVEDKLTETMNKVRLDDNLQNPILRIGRSGNTYSKILSTESMGLIKDHYKDVHSRYDKIKSNIEKSSRELEGRINRTISAYGEIRTCEISEFIGLEQNVTLDSDLPFDLAELRANKPAQDNLSALRDEMLQLKSKLYDSKNNIAQQFRTLYPDDQSTVAFGHFITLLSIVDRLRDKANRNIDLLHQIYGAPLEGVTALIDKVNHGANLLYQIYSAYSEDIAALREYITRCSQLKSNWLGYVQNKQIKALNEELDSKLHNIEQLGAAVQRFQIIDRHREEKVKETGFYLTQDDFDKSAHQSRDHQTPACIERSELLEIIASIKRRLDNYPINAARMGCASDDLFRLAENKLVGFSDEKFNDLTRYLYLERKLSDQFNKIPDQTYMLDRGKIEEGIITQMTHKLDENVVYFYENHRNDAKTLSSMISKKQRFDRSSFLKLKQFFPCILAGIRDFAEYIPLESEIFDIVIIDEASQVSIAQALPALLRAKKVIVLGDKKQFSNVKSSHAGSETNREYLNSLRKVFMETISDEAAKLERMSKFNIKTSALEFFERISNYNIMLKKHFRGYKELINYSSKHFYKNSLQAIKIRVKPIDDVIKFSFIEHDGREEIVANTNHLECAAIIAEVERIAIEEPNHTIGIITPHPNQQKLLSDTFAKHDSYESIFTKRNKLKIMTFDGCQGEERDIILYSMVANAVSDKLWAIFIRDRNSVDLEADGQIRLQRLNVGLSRAKERVHFFLSKPLEDFNGSIGEALRHYSNTLEDARKLPNAASTDHKSPMEQKVLHWIQETEFFRENMSSIEVQSQFPLGEYIKQLDKRYSHPAFVVDFLLVYTNEQSKQRKIVIEYDGFEFHFHNHSEVNVHNYEEYYTEHHVYREKVLESYGFNFLRINRFNIGEDPVATLNTRLMKLTCCSTRRSGTR